MSLSTEPVFSLLKNDFVCGTKDISNEPYCGVSGRHSPSGQGIKTTNGAGPHNLQLFVLAPDGTVLHCLPGYWSSQDLALELGLAKELYAVWRNPSLSQDQKNTLAKKMQIGHISQHSQSMVKRSKMQSFDQKFEARHRPFKSDTIKNPQLAVQALASKDNLLLNQSFKTTDQIVHERMASRIFVPYNQFDVAQFSDYGRQKYEKHEDYRDMSGKLVQEPPKNRMSGQKRIRSRILSQFR